MLERLQSCIKTLGEVLDWFQRYGIDGAFRRLLELLNLSISGFDKGFYQKEVFDLSGLHPIVHYLGEGRAMGYRATPPKPKSDLKLSEMLAQGSENEVAFGVVSALLFRPSCVGRAPEDKRLKVGVVMPCWNASDTISAAIHSVLAQLHSEVVLVVVDDGSEDGSCGVVESHFSNEIESGIVTLLKSPHVGVSKSRNLGLEWFLSGNSKVTWVAYLDSDNTWVPDHLAVHIKALSTQNKCWSYGAMTSVLVDGEGYDMPAREYDRFLLLQENWIDLNTLVHYIGCIPLIGGFDPRLRRLVDYDFALRLGRLGPPIVITKPTANYTVSTDSISSRESFLQAREIVRFNQICERISWGLEEPNIYIEDTIFGEIFERMSLSGFFTNSPSRDSSDVCLIFKDLLKSQNEKIILVISNLNQVPLGAEESPTTYILLSLPSEVRTADDIGRLAKCFCVSELILD